MKKPLIRVAVIVLALVVIGVVGWMWWKDAQKAPSPAPEQVTLLDTVDRGIKPEDMAIQEQKIADLQAQIAQVEASGGRDISLILQLGNLYYGIGELEKASEQYLNILATNPNDAPSLENLAQTQLERGDYHGAELGWRAALKLNPYEQTYLKLADLIDEHFPERNAEIGPLLEDAIATLGQQTNLLIRLGDWYAENKNYDEAISHYQVASQLSPNNQGLKEEIERLKQLRTEQASL